MYVYTFKLKFSMRSTALKFNEYKNIFFDAIDNINDGAAFKRDGKRFNIVQIEDKFLILTLSSKNSLKNPTRSISALTRYLTTYHFNIFGNSIYNKTLFCIEMLSHENHIPRQNPQDLSNEDLIKGMIDLVYGYTSTSNSDALSREQTIQKIKQLVAPYIKR